MALGRLLTVPAVVIGLCHDGFKQRLLNGANHHVVETVWLAARQISEVRLHAGVDVFFNILSAHCVVLVDGHKWLPISSQLIQAIICPSRKIGVNRRDLFVARDDSVDMTA